MTPTRQGTRWPWWLWPCMWAMAMWWVGCPAPPTPPPPPPPPPPTPAILETPGTTVSFAWANGWKTKGRFFDFPFPSELRLDPRGFPDLSGFPNPEDNALIKNLLAGLMSADNPFFGAKGFPVVPVAYFRFDGALSTQDETKPIMPSASAPVMLLNVTPKSPHRGEMVPVVAHILEAGNYVPKTVLSISAYPGMVLRPEQRYAFVVMRQLKDASGQALGVPKALNLLKAGQAPQEQGGDALQALYAPLWETLTEKGIKVSEVAAATVFQTRDVVQQVAQHADQVMRQITTKISGLRLDTNEPDRGDHADFCELHGTITLPQLQQGEPPYDQAGQMAFAGWANQVEPVRTVAVPFALSIPKKAMPSEGYPLLLYIHGTSGTSTEVIDRGKRSVAGGPKAPGEGPAMQVATLGVAAAGLAMNLNKDRLPGGVERSYLNLNNLSAYSFTFVQGTIELRLFLRALLALEIKPETLGACKGASLPAGAMHYRFSDQRVSVLGQSMGASYAAMFGAVEPQVQAIIPTGTGGLCSFFIANSNNPLLRPSLLQRVLGSEETLVYHHPILQLVQMSWEAADPAVYAPHVTRDPLPQHPTRHVLLPIGRADQYHPEIVMDVVALAYGLQQAGETIWPGTQERLTVGGWEGILPYPIKQNYKAPKGLLSATQVVVQYPEDPITQDGHQIAYQRDDTIAQWRCFVASFVATGIPVVTAPKDLGAPCP